jgi:glycosyltransferase involved in cell wall biosynthesis
MSNKQPQTFLLLAGHADSIIKFRGKLIDELQSLSFKVHIAAPKLDAHSTVFEVLNSKGVVLHKIPLVRTGLNPLNDMYLLISLWYLMLRIRPHILLSYTVKPVIYGSLVGRLVGVPNIFALITGLGYAFAGADGRVRKFVRYILRKLYSISLRNATKIIFQNKDDEKLFRNMGIIGHEKLSCVVNGSGVDLVKFHVAPIPNKISFLMIARLLGDKGLREYIESARRVKKHHSNIEFVLVGWLDENPDAITQSELDKWGDDGVVSFLGKLEDVREVISNSSVYVLPSYREGTPRTVLEAMAMGRAIITTDAPGCRETVIDTENGFLVGVQSVDDLEKAMLKFINQPSLAISMGERSREIAEEKYDVHKVNNNMLREMGI